MPLPLWGILKKSGRSDTSLLQGMQCVCASAGFELS
jgi:hypothetical protein